MNGSRRNGVSKTGTHPGKRDQIILNHFWRRTAVNKTLINTLGAAALLASAGALASDEANLKALAGTCNNCHGIDGISAGESMPSIGGLPEAYLKEVMLESKSGERFSTTMGRLLKGYSDEQIAELAKLFAAKPWTPVAQELDAKKLRKGKFTLERCQKCHGETGSGEQAKAGKEKDEEEADEDTPRLDGQWAKYIELELLKYRDKEVKLSHKKMRNTSSKLTEEEVSAIAQYYASQKK
jgi:cytochrome subunit of sulfide dehydrogenase